LLFSGTKDFPIILIGNKIDLVDEISPEMDIGVEKLSEIIAEELKTGENPILTIKTSAKTGMNIFLVLPTIFALTKFMPIRCVLGEDERSPKSFEI